MHELMKALTGTAGNAFLFSNRIRVRCKMTNKRLIRYVFLVISILLLSSVPAAHVLADQPIMFSNQYIEEWTTPCDGFDAVTFQVLDAKVQQMFDKKGNFKNAHFHIEVHSAHTNSVTGRFVTTDWTFQISKFVVDRTSEMISGYRTAIRDADGHLILAGSGHFVWNYLTQEFESFTPGIARSADVAPGSEWANAVCAALS